MEIGKKEYEQYVKEDTPVHSCLRNAAGAFLSGGAVCAVSQGILNLAVSRGADEQTAAVWTLLTLIFVSDLLTGINVFQKLVRFCGAGILVPITGFANAVAAPALEYRAEGEVFGIGCRIFTIAGPVILYGILTSFGLGLLAFAAKAAGFQFI